MPADDTILRASHIRVVHRVPGATPTVAVDDVSLSVRAGSTVGLIGESGSGKTSLGRVLALLSPPQGGQVEAFGVPDVFGARRIPRDLRRTIQMVHQDTGTALDPLLSIVQSVREPLDIEGGRPRAERTERALRLLEQVQLNPDLASKRPSELSGGQRQRVIIARAVSTQPKLIICDEAVSALDLSVQAEVLNLLQDLKRDLQLSYVFISHNLGVVLHVSDEVAVMYRGTLVEWSTAAAIAARPMHPYTELLLRSIPDPTARITTPRGAATPSAASHGSSGNQGCAFVDRCAYARKVCHDKPPDLREVSPGRLARCHVAEELALHG